MVDIGKDDAESFIAKWQGVSASELSTSQSFLGDLCRLLGVDTPHPTPEQDYMFERPISFAHADGSTRPGRIDLYRAGAFVLESKRLTAGRHTKGFDDAMLRAHSQAQRYARALPAAEGRPPFLLVVDVGHRIELYAEFTRSGATYTPFPDPRSHRIALEDLRDPDIRERLRKVWTDPLDLDPSRESARVTREIAERLAKLARSLEKASHPPERVAQFLMRCLFTMFAEDVRLLPAHSFRDLLLTYADQPDVAMRMVRQLWIDMDAGTEFSTVVRDTVLRFNGKLFKQPDILPLDREQVALLAKAAHAKWQHVEPAIFGTLLERALEPSERHKLGAHYTPRAYVERLVLPTVIEPLRKQWGEAQAAALVKATEAEDIAAQIEALPARSKSEKNLKAKLREARDDAVAILRGFHHRLCSVRVLDPACGSGNFLYVTLEHLKRLEGEVLNALDELGYQQADLALAGERADAAAGETVDPHNLIGIELNPRAAAIAEVVLWIGYLQWHFRTRGDVTPPTPVIRDFRNIVNRDAVLAFDAVEYVTDEQGRPVTRWDGETMKLSPVTGEKVPDENARKPVERYLNPRKAAWPEADFVVGNPPFIGNKRMRSALGDGYVEALRGAWPQVPESADFVMYWWHHAAQLTRRGALQRFGFITTNGIRQAFNRKVVAQHLSDAKSPISFVFAVPDHPWVDSADGASVRIAMTVAAEGTFKGALSQVQTESSGDADEIDVVLNKEHGRIFEDLRTGVDVISAGPLQSNVGLASRGVTLVGQGFVVPKGLTSAVGDAGEFLKPYVTGRGLSQNNKRDLVLDFYGLTVDQVSSVSPAGYQWLLDRVKPERLQNNRAAYRDRWWVFAEPRASFRRAATGLRRVLVTPRTAKHRFFKFEEPNVQFESEVVGIALDDALGLGVLSSSVHLAWVEANAASFGAYVGNIRYNQTRCFDPFPLPNLEHINEDATDRIRDLAEQLDAHRKRQQAAHPGLTLTGMYNVLAKLRSREPLTAKERTIHEQGLVSVLRELHDDLDAVVLTAYGWDDLQPLLRIAMGTDARVPRAQDAQERPHGLEPLSLRERGWGEGTGAREYSSADEPSPPAPLPEGEGNKAMTRAEARRAFDEAVLERLVALNAERAAEETRGHVRWLRPQFQNRDAVAAEHAGPEQEEIDTGAPTAETVAVAKPAPWPKDTVAQVKAVADLLAASPVPMSLDEIAARFSARGPWKKRLPQLLDMLVAIGRAQLQDDGRHQSL